MSNRSYFQLENHLISIPRNQSHKLIDFKEKDKVHDKYYGTVEIPEPKEEALLLEGLQNSIAFNVYTLCSDY